MTCFRIQADSLGHDTVVVDLGPEGQPRRSLRPHLLRNHFDGFVVVVGGHLQSRRTPSDQSVLRALVNDGRRTIRGTRKAVPCYGAGMAIQDTTSPELYERGL
eukprot:2672-Pyramimonas_sp.AAC.1